MFRLVSQVPGIPLQRCLFGRNALLSGCGLRLVFAVRAVRRSLSCGLLTANAIWSYLGFMAVYKII